MIWINGKWTAIETALEVLALAREIARTEKISHRDALRKAVKLLPDLTKDVEAGTRFIAARVVLFTPQGRPRRRRASGVVVA